MKRITFSLAQIADVKNLQLAFSKAAKAKRHRQSVQAFEHEFDRSINALAQDILLSNLPYGRYRRFAVCDPKFRIIHAACFEDRVFHHALINLLGPVLERAMAPTSFACRPGMGVHKAIVNVQDNLRRYAYLVKIDIDGYFAAIDHKLLLGVLARRFKGRELTRQIDRVIASYGSSTTKGLPIGSLTSQYFANYFLDGLDRLMAREPNVRAQVRYMDDIIWWCDTKAQCNTTLKMVTQFLQSLGLAVKANVHISDCSQGVTYCGYRIFRGQILLSDRKRRRYQERRLFWENQFALGNLGAADLQRAYSSVEAICTGTDSNAWRRRNLALRPPLEV